MYGNDRIKAARESVPPEMANSAEYAMRQINSLEGDLRGTLMHLRADTVRIETRLAARKYADLNIMGELGKSPADVEVFVARIAELARMLERMGVKA